MDVVLLPIPIEHIELISVLTKIFVTIQQLFYAAGLNTEHKQLYFNKTESIKVHL